ncbi:MAG: spore germination protein [Firmicutes bacterium]|nr:endospore germination permease [Dethiobacter sp.]MBS3899654.1 endospore germination permease [Dethiobacter sp.]MCL4464283.1 spore germination protein [Bacillota bacterium]MCL5993280.1 spore germination protein [Bacillota bacterium]
MLEKGRISPRQTGQLLFITTIATVIFFAPSLIASLAGHDAWLAALLGPMFTLITLLLITWLGRKHPGQTIFQYSETILGKWLGKAVALLYVWGFLHIGAMAVREFGDFMTTSFMSHTPISVFNFSMLLLCAWSVLVGLEVIARMNEFIIILIVSFLLLILFFSLPNWELDYLLPFFARGPLPVLQAALIPAAWHGNIIVLAVILPFMTRPTRAFLAGTAAIFASTTLLTIGVVGMTAIFGPELSSSFLFPLHLFAQTINIGQIITRFESVVMTTWMAGIFIKTSVFYYCAALGLAQVLNLKEVRPVVLPLGIILGTLSISLFQDVTMLGNFLKETRPYYTISLYFLGLPLLLFAVTLIREKIFGVCFGEQTNEA